MQSRQETVVPVEPGFELVAQIGAQERQACFSGLQQKSCRDGKQTVAQVDVGLGMPNVLHGQTVAFSKERFVGTVDLLQGVTGQQQSTLHLVAVNQAQSRIQPETPVVVELLARGQSRVEAARAPVVLVGKAGVAPVYLAVNGGHLQTGVQMGFFAYAQSVPPGKVKPVGRKGAPCGIVATRSEERRVGKECRSGVVAVACKVREVG